VLRLGFLFFLLRGFFEVVGVEYLFGFSGVCICFYPFTSKSITLDLFLPKDSTFPTSFTLLIDSLAVEDSKIFLPGRRGWTRRKWRVGKVGNVLRGRNPVKKLADLEGIQSRRIRANLYVEESS